MLYGGVQEPWWPAGLLQLCDLKEENFYINFLNRIKYIWAGTQRWCGSKVHNFC